MTICIAAITEKNKIVAVTDRMLTLEEPVKTTYEITENNKAIELTENVIALFAGDVIMANEILAIAKVKVAANDPETTKEIANIVNEAFTEHWEKVINNFLLRKFKITFQQFMHNQNAFDAELVRKISDFIAKFKINVEIIVTGKTDKEEEAHIYVMDQLGTVVCLDSIGYACIGSGSRHATFSLIESEINKLHSITQSLQNLLKAKTRAEYDPGVGKLCDIVIINGGIKRYDEDSRNAILKLFIASQKEHNKLERKLIRELAKVI